MTKSGDVWTYTGDGTPTRIIFNNNDNGKQTGNLTFVDGATYNTTGVIGGGEQAGDNRKPDMTPTGSLPVIYITTDEVMIDRNLRDKDYRAGAYYLLDNSNPANNLGSGEKVRRITPDTPEVLSDIQRKFLTEQFKAMDDMVFANNDDLWRYLDLDDAARYYIVMEIIDHWEAYHGSTYLFRDFGAGPPPLICRPRLRAGLLLGLLHV